MNNKIGVIIPVYKTEKYVAECIESILAQTYTNFRLILVDDGTPDNAGKICDEYAKKDNRITVIHQENAGVTRARAAGVEAANDCEWITFVDSDDTITIDALEHLFLFAKEDVEIIISPVDEHVKEFFRRIPIIEYRKLSVRNTSFIDAPWGKLIKRKLFKEYIFDIPAWFKVHEDTLMNIRLAFSTNKDVAICDKEIYLYRMNEHSITHVFKKDLEYEELFHEYRMRSIPQEDRALYINYTIPIRLIRLKKFLFYKHFVKDVISTTFYKELKKDIEYTKFHLNAIDKILFYNSNPVVRFFAINVRKLVNIYIGYHKTK